MLTAAVAGVMIGAGMELLFERFRPQTKVAFRALATLGVVLLAYALRAAIL
jgi:hypothetical protein